MPSLYSPTGMVMSKTAQEAIGPSVGHKIERRKLANLSTLPGRKQSGTRQRQRPVCPKRRWSHIWLEFTPSIAEWDYGSAMISLCLVK